jgi:hypothetical protein
VGCDDQSKYQGADPGLQSDSRYGGHFAKKRWKSEPKAARGEKGLRTLEELIHALKAAAQEEKSDDVSIVGEERLELALIRLRLSKMVSSGTGSDYVPVEAYVEGGVRRKTRFMSFMKHFGMNRITILKELCRKLGFERVDGHNSIRCLHTCP